MKRDREMMLGHPVVKKVHTLLVADKGGLVIYETGCGGREASILAAVDIHKETKFPLMIVEPKCLHKLHWELIGEDLPNVYMTSPQKIRTSAVWDLPFIFCMNLDALPRHRSTATYRKIREWFACARHTFISAHPPWQYLAAEEAHQKFFQARPMLESDQIHEIRRRDFVEPYLEPYYNV